MAEEHFYYSVNMHGLEVRNHRLHLLSSDPLSPNEGDIWWNTVDHIPKVRTNTVTRNLLNLDDDFYNFVAVKASIDTADELLIADSADTFAYKRITRANLVAGLGTASNAYYRITAQTGDLNLDATGEDPITISGDGAIFTTVGAAGTINDLSLALLNQNANLVFAGPSSGGAATPTFRALVNDDMPSSYSPTSWDAAYTHSQATSGNPHSVVLSDLGLALVQTVGNPGTASNIVSEAGIYAAISSAIGAEDFWDRVTGTPNYVHLKTPADELHVDVMNEYTTDTGITAEGVRFENSNIYITSPAASQGVGVAQLGQVNYVPANSNEDAYLFSGFVWLGGSSTFGGASSGYGGHALVMKHYRGSDTDYVYTHLAVDSDDASLWIKYNADAVDATAASGGTWYKLENYVPPTNLVTTTGPTPVANRVAIFSGAATIYADSDLNFSGSKLTIGSLTSNRTEIDAHNISIYRENNPQTIRSNVYGNTPSHVSTHYFFRSGGTIASQAAAPTNAEVFKGTYAVAYGPASTSGAATVLLSVDGAVGGTGEFDTKWEWEMREGASFGLMLTLGVDGLEYAADHSTDQAANDRWIPDKGYVDGVVSGVNYWSRVVGTPNYVTPLTAADALYIPSLGTGGLTDYDAYFGDALTTETYGLIKIGNSSFGRTSYNVTALDIDGAVIIRNMGTPATSNIEYLFADSTNSIRFALAKPGAGLATYSPRSMIIAGPAALDDTIVTVGYWQGLGIFDNLAMDVGTNGADLGVQNDAEIEGTLYVDTISESTLNAGIIIDQLRVEDKRIYFDTNTYILGTTTTLSFTTVGNTRLSIDQTAGEVYVNAILSVSDRLGTAVGTPVASKGFIYMDSADDKLYFKNSTTTFDLTNLGTSVSFGTEDQIPHMNTGGTDFDYTDNFRYHTSGYVDIVQPGAATSYVRTQYNYFTIYVLGTLRTALTPSASDSAVAVAYQFDSSTNFVTAGAKLVSVQNQNVEKFFIDKDGNVDIEAGAEYRINGVAIGTGPDYWSRTTGTPNYVNPATSGDWIYTDGGIHFDGVDGVISADDGSASDGYSILVQAGDPVGATNDGGSVTLKAGDALSADSGSTPGAVYLMPGSPWQTSTVSQVYLGDSTYNADTIGIQATGSQTDVNLALSTKGDGSISLLADDIDLWNMRVYEFISDMIITTASTYDLKLVGGAGSTNQDGRDIHVESGQGNGTGDGGNLYMYRGPAGVSGTIGHLYFGDGSGGALSLDAAATNVVGYDTSTGQLTYRTAAGIGSSTFIALSDTPTDWTGGVAGYLVMVDATPDAVEFIDPTTITLNTWEDTLDGALAILGLGTTNPVSIRVPHASAGSTQLQFPDGQEMWISTHTSTTYSGFFAIHGLGQQHAYSAVSFSGGQKRFDINATAMQITDGEDGIGLQYFADYSTNGIALGNRWIPDKGYVDSVAGASWGTATLQQVVFGSSPGDIQSSADFTYNATAAILKIEGQSGDLPEVYVRNAAGSNFRFYVTATSPPTGYIHLLHASGKLEIIVGAGTFTYDATSFRLGTANDIEWGTGGSTTIDRLDNSGSDLSIKHFGNIVNVIDSDGNDTTRYFRIAKDNIVSTSATTLFEVTEAGVLTQTQTHTNTWTVTTTPVHTVLVDNPDTSTLANKYSAITFESHAAAANTNLSSIVSIGPTASSDSTYMYFMGTDASSNWLTGLGVRFGVDVFMYDHHAAAAWNDYPTALPSRALLIQRSLASGDITGDYSGILIHAKPTAGQNSYGFLGVEAIGGANHSTRFNMLLRGTGSSDYETVFSADYNSIYRWKANSTSRDIIHHLESNSTTVCVLGWDPVGTSGFQIHTGTGFQATTITADFVINTSGHLFFGNIQNLTNTNYLRYNSTTGEVTWLSTSDISLKKNVKSWEPDSLDFLINLGVISFDRKDKSCYNEIGWNGTLMEQLMPDMTWRDDKNLVNIKDAHFPFHLHRAIQQLGERVEALETLEERVVRLERENVDLRRQLLNIKNDESN